MDTAWWNGCLTQPNPVFNLKSCPSFEPTQGLRRSRTFPATESTAKKELAKNECDFHPFTHGCLHSTCTVWTLTIERNGVYFTVTCSNNAFQYTQSTQPKADFIDQLLQKETDTCCTQTENVKLNKPVSSDAPTSSKDITKNKVHTNKKHVKQA